MHSMAVKRSSKTQASRTDTTRRTRLGTILRTKKRKMRRVRTGGRVTKTMRGRS